MCLSMMLCIDHVTNYCTSASTKVHGCHISSDYTQRESWMYPQTRPFVVLQSIVARHVCVDESHSKCSTRCPVPQEQAANNKIEREWEATRLPEYGVYNMMLRNAMLMLCWNRT